MEVTVVEVKRLLTNGGLAPVSGNASTVLVRASGWTSVPPAKFVGSNVAAAKQCAHVVVINPLGFPAAITVSMSSASLGYTTGEGNKYSVFNATRIFLGGYNVSVAVTKGAVLFTDWVDASGVNVYRLGCDVVSASSENLVSNPGFEDLPTPRTAKHWTVPHTTFGMDTRAWIEADTREPYAGRHSGAITVPAAGKAGRAVFGLPAANRKPAPACNGTRVIRPARQFSPSFSSAQNAISDLEANSTVVCSQLKPEMGTGVKASMSFCRCLLPHLLPSAGTTIGMAARAAPLGANLTLTIATGVFKWVRGNRQSSAVFELVIEHVLVSRTFSEASTPLSEDAKAQWVHVNATVPDGLSGGLLVIATGDAPGTIFLDEVDVRAAKL